jgi:hypothetical protein
VSEELTTRPVPPLYPHVFVEMAEEGLLDYGCTVEWIYLEEKLRVSPADRKAGAGAWLREWLPLRQLFETDRGLMVTEAGLKGTGFRFYKREEMADEIARREKKKARDTIRKSVCLSMVPRENLPEAEQKKLDHWENKTAWIGAFNLEMLRKRKVLQEPRRCVQKLLKQPKDDREGGGV